MKEQWKRIEGLEDRYMISNKGRIKTVERFIKYRKGSDTVSLFAERILKTKISKFGYEHVILSNGTCKKDFSIHRLVAKAFIPNPDNKPCIDHLDGNKRNNNINNLEWVTYAENNQRAYDLGLKRRIHAGQFTSMKGIRR